MTKKTPNGVKKLLVWKQGHSHQYGWSGFNHHCVVEIRFFEVHTLSNSGYGPFSQMWSQYGLKIVTSKVCATYVAWYLDICTECRHCQSALALHVHCLCWIHCVWVNDLRIAQDKLCSICINCLALTVSVNLPFFFVCSLTSFLPVTKQTMGSYAIHVCRMQFPDTVLNAET